jgi:hypothetical protein
MRLSGNFNLANGKHLFFIQKSLFHLKTLDKPVVFSKLSDSASSESGGLKAVQPILQIPMKTPVKALIRNRIAVKKDRAGNRLKTLRIN